ncbi:hypothetical protein [Deinococcus planocerae]|uniref:hypothetical protein n=1 Tax=Deinococcus planocerae TaxID=1737569 RepID=UPI000C7F32B3|nr:hypothetical protein [Deinococcus planocerae]
MKPPLWLLIADAGNPDAALALPTVAWMARDAGAAFEGYLEARRDGLLFAGSGSTVLGGAHHQQFNYLNAAFDVSYVLLGDTALFDSSIQAFGGAVLVRARTLPELYAALLDQPGVGEAGAAVLAPAGPVRVGGRDLDLVPYLYPEVYFRRALAFSGAAEDAAALIEGRGVREINHLHLSEAGRTAVSSRFPTATALDAPREDDTYGSITLRLAGRWKDRARGVAFGDPVAILSQIASLCREDRVAVYGEKVELPAAQVQVQPYTEEKSEIAAETARLALEVRNPVLVGRQTGDGDLFEWSRSGVCLQIMDPNRPAFPVVATVPHTWATAKGDLYAEEPDDETLRRYAHEGRILATLVWHSGEMAHNEAMLGLFELAGFTGLKMGYGVHAARYETSPQLWELLQIPREKGGVLGLAEPLLHSGGLGVMAEVNCPPERLREHCEAALDRIRLLAGKAATPRGYYAFMDANLATLSPGPGPLYDAVAASGLEYFVSSAGPGRNRIIHRQGDFLVLNQTPRSVASASPFARVTTVEELLEAPPLRPGWMIATLDAPVIAFNPYIWRHGSRFMGVVDWMLSDRVVNVLPGTVARYARVLAREGFLPVPAGSVAEEVRR